MGGKDMEKQDAKGLVRFFESRFGTHGGLLEDVMGSAVSRSVDDADLYFEYTTARTLSLEEGIVKKGGLHVSQGVGARVVSGEKTGYAMTEEVRPDSLREIVRTARAISLESSSGGTLRLAGDPLRTHSLYPVPEEALDVPVAEKKGLLLEADRIARSADPRVSQVFASVSTEMKHVMVVRKDGHLSVDRLPLIRVNVTVIAEENGQRQTGSYGYGGRIPFSEVTGEVLAHAAREAARQAIVNLSARPCPTGTMPVVLGPGWPGILLHEAIGHGLEGDFNRKGTSAFSGRIGERVASPLCTIVDDGTLSNRRGSLNVDDEGTPTQRTVLIENGILKGYLQDRLNARLMGMSPTGNGRRESYAHVPMPRMTNTVMLAGESDPEEIVRSLGKGLYAVNFGGGQVDITSGKFVFSTSEAYWVENGKIQYPVRGATLIGNGPDVLTRVTMVGSDLELDPGVGTCGKDGQSVPVGVGLPTLRIEDLTVGGTA
jgi:TldD protein